MTQFTTHPVFLGFFPNFLKAYRVKDGQIEKINTITRKRIGSVPFDGADFQPVDGGLDTLGVGSLKIKSRNTQELIWENIRNPEKVRMQLEQIALLEEDSDDESSPGATRRHSTPPPLNDIEKQDGYISTLLVDYQDFKWSLDKEGMRKTAIALEDERADFANRIATFTEPAPLSQEEKSDPWVCEVYKSYNRFAQHEELREKLDGADRLREARNDLATKFQKFDEHIEAYEAIIEGVYSSGLDFPDWIPKAKNHDLPTDLLGYKVFVKPYEYYHYSRWSAAKQLTIQHTQDEIDDLCERVRKDAKNVDDLVADFRTELQSNSAIENSTAAVETGTPEVKRFEIKDQADNIDVNADVMAAIKLLDVSQPLSKHEVREKWQFWMKRAPESMIPEINAAYELLESMAD